jgi:hypothetical protein
VREFFLTLLNNESCQFARVYGWIADPLKDVRKSADMVEVTMRNDDGADAVFPFFEIFRVRENEIDARSCFVMEHKPAVDNDNVLANLNREHVATNFLDSTKYDDADITRSERWNLHLLFGGPAAVVAYLLDAIARAREVIARRTVVAAQGRPALPVRGNATS